MIFLVGGSRSGKSEFALELAKEIGEIHGKVAFLAPFAMENFAPEVRARAEEQQRARPEQWLNFEPPFDFVTIAELWKRKEIKALILDSLNLWMGHELTLKSSHYDGNLLATHCRKESEHLVSVLLQLGIPLILISAEVNAGVSPSHESGRLFRDLVADMNRGLARRAKLVLQLHCGIATAIKYPLNWSQSFSSRHFEAHTLGNQAELENAMRPALIVQPVCAKYVF